MQVGLVRLNVLRTRPAATDATVHSFDVFDTVLARPWFRPADLFYAVAIEARHAGLWPRPIEAFRDMRVVAEAEARRATTRDEVCLSDIYAVLARHAGWTEAVRDHVAQIEQAVELDSCRPIAETLDHARALVARGQRVVFVSDTYLDQAFIGRMLHAVGFPVQAARVFASSAHGCTKWTGRLFREVLAELNASPQNLRHLGDNPVSDVRLPRRVGIDARPFRGGRESRYEAAFAAAGRATPILSSAIAGSARSARLARRFDDARRQTIWDTATNVSGPLLTGYVLWLLARAVAQGRRRLYFLARDGQILKRLAEAFVRWYGLDIDIRYLHVSRRALFLAALREVDAHALDWFVEDAQGKRFQDILARLDLDVAQIGEHAGGIAAETSLTPAAVDAVRRLLGSEQVAPAILAAAARRRALVVDYLRQEGMLDGTPFAIVDIGWRGRLQRALHGILVRDGLLTESALLGFYLGTFVPLAQMPWGIIETCLPPGRGYHAAVIEFFAAADHGTTLGYARAGERIRPVLDAPPDDATLKAEILLQQDGILAFAAGLERALRQPAFALGDLAAAVRHAGLAAAERFLSRPSVDEAEVFGAVQHASDQAHLQARDIAPRVGAGTALLAVLGHQAPLRRVSDWSAASLRRSLPAWAGTAAFGLFDTRRRCAVLLRGLARRAGTARIPSPKRHVL